MTAITRQICRALPSATTALTKNSPLEAVKTTHATTRAYYSLGGMRGTPTPNDSLIKLITAGLFLGGFIGYEYGHKEGQKEMLNTLKNSPNYPIIIGQTDFGDPIYQAFELVPQRLYEPGSKTSTAKFEDKNP